MARRDYDASVVPVFISLSVPCRLPGIPLIEVDREFPSVPWKDALDFLRQSRADRSTRAQGTLAAWEEGDC